MPLASTCEAAERVRVAHDERPAILAALREIAHADLNAGFAIDRAAGLRRQRGIERGLRGHPSLLEDEGILATIERAATDEHADDEACGDRAPLRQRPARAR